TEWDFTDKMILIEHICRTETDTPTHCGWARAHTSAGLTILAVSLLIHLFSIFYAFNTIINCFNDLNSIIFLFYKPTYIDGQVRK
ncbi:hypothetical protein L9F63_012202, partial [Diploptera punctata]